MSVWAHSSGAIVTVVCAKAATFTTAIHAASADLPQPETIRIRCPTPNGNFQTRILRSIRMPPLLRLSVPLSGPFGGTGKPVLEAKACVTQQAELSCHRLRVAVSVGHDGRRSREQVIGSHLDTRVPPAPSSHINKKGLQVMQVDFNASPLNPGHDGLNCLSPLLDPFSECRLHHLS
ncbi:hypothetical protein AA309_17345 [Microvirga vignae]|uniref:Uncharacterized protein n=1 Tax=Microvirga vignae TaxID=1225564 RepID=A0A0H1R9M6_9HYPH|nr:hypothetical protein [Microvirga vignae]KLK91873.1 hypothetical protein AA309_17345 [Microvirga vignae]